jgi:hypothetical protein
MMTTYTSLPTRRTDSGPTAPHRLRIGTAALMVGLVSQLPLGMLHPHREDPNDSVAAFHEYAHSQDWVLVHLGQFLGMVVVTVGLVSVATTLARRPGAAGFLGFVAAVTALLSAAVFAVQMAVDGVALKAAVDAWQSATGATDQATAFAVADSARSLEKGLSALFNLTNGITLLSLGAGLVVGEGAGRRLGWLAATAGVGLLTVGVLTARTGFSHEASAAALPTTAVLAVFGIAMVVATWSPRRHPAAGVAVRTAGSATTGPDSSGRR